MSKIIKVPFEELEINKCEALRYAGVRLDADQKLMALFDEALSLLSDKVNPKAVYREVEVAYSDDGVYLGEDFIKSQGLKKFLQGADKAAIFAATAGIEADRLISRYSMVTPSLALMIDATAAAAVEAFCDRLCSCEFKVDKGRRFSPGYGDFPIEYQHRVIELLSADHNIGVSLTNSLMLAPSKSVTAVVPIKGR